MLFQGFLILTAKLDVTKMEGKCGWKHKTAPKTDKLLIIKSAICLDKTSNDLRNLAARGTEIHSPVVWCRLLEVGRTERRPIKRQLLTSKIMKTQLQWPKNTRT